MASTSQIRPIPKMPSARDVMTVGSYTSPLAQLRHATVPPAPVASSSKSVLPIPQLDFNLFRTPSIYSVGSLTSLSTFSQEDELPRERSESPTTPRAAPERKEYFDLGPPVVSPTKSQTGMGLTPSRSFKVTSRQPLAPSSPQTAELQYHLRAMPSRYKADPKPVPHDVPLPSQPYTTDPSTDWASIHGEQGSDWGEDEAQFEWLDTGDVPEAVNGGSVRRSGMSPSRRLSIKIKAAVKPTLSVGGGEGRKLRKPLVFPRRAAPPPPSDEEQPRSPTFGKPPEPVRPPPPSTRSVQHLVPPPPSSQPYRTPSPTQSPRPSPKMIPLKGDEYHLSSPKPRNTARNSQISFQSMAYSFYDIEDDCSTPTTPKSQEIVFPNGKYMKVSVSSLERGKDSQTGLRTKESLTGSEVNACGKTRADLVNAGIEERGKGDLPKAAWYFMKAAEGGSVTGRMYWGLALRHGWGVARDDRRAFAELRQACDDSLHEGGLNFHQSPGAIKLSSQQKKSLARDLSLGMFEIANCFLEGVGVKKSPEIALAYLRFAGDMGDLASQEQLGFLLSKGTGSIKKDMKEAAKWYRMAIGQGSTNTFGLAWVWKDKYME